MSVDKNTDEYITLIVDTGNKSYQVASCVYPAKQIIILKWSSGDDVRFTWTRDDARAYFQSCFHLFHSTFLSKMILDGVAWNRLQAAKT